jgi:prepilin-type N-terminal cleavage/methylation domain-containing protein
MPDPGANCPSSNFGLPLCRTSSVPRAGLAGRQRRAFTLVELLVVVALISILAAVVGFSINGNTPGMSLSNAQRNLMAVIQAARTGATIQHTRARLIIYADRNAVPGESSTSTVTNSKILRYYGVIFAESDDPHAPQGTNPLGPPYLRWRAASNGDYLPNGLYFVPSKSSTFATDVPTFSTSRTSAVDDSKGDYSVNYYALAAAGTSASYDIHATGITTGIMQISFPLTEALEGDPSGDWYYFIEFTPDGFYYNTNGNNNIIIGAAQTASDSSISFQGSGTNVNQMFTGVQLRALGGPAPFRGPSDFETSGQ